MDITQVLLSVTLTVTTVFLIVIGVQLIFLFKELRIMLRKVNDIVEGFEKLGMNVESGFSELLGFFGGLKTFFKVMDAVRKRKHEK